MATLRASGIQMTITTPGIAQITAAAEFRRRLLCAGIHAGVLSSMKVRPRATACSSQGHVLLLQCASRRKVPVAAEHLLVQLRMAVW
jgi:hypothetical protein